MSVVGVIVIGRNEGQRLRRCIESVRRAAHHVVYVDSGSTDGSLEWARSTDIETIELDTTLPFTAGRARNVGFERLRHSAPEVRYVQCIDGDCELNEGWLERGAQTLDNEPAIAVVCGRLRERSPDASIYNRLCQIEWDSSFGAIDYSGGIFMIRADLFAAVNGFNPTIPAGEEPELCARLRADGWKIIRLKDPMAVHDAAMARFGQWWLRQVRTAHGAMDLATRFGLATHQRELTSTRVWTMGWLAAVILATCLGAALGGWPLALGAGGVAALLLPFQMARVALRMRSQGHGWKPSLGGGVLIMLAKWPQLLGQLRYWLDRRGGQVFRRFDYKQSAAEAAAEDRHVHARRQSDWRADRRRYPPRSFLREPSIWAVAVYRFGRWADRQPRGLRRWVLHRIYGVAFHFLEVATGISIHKSVRIGPGLRIWHFGNIFVHEQVTIGAHCTLRQGVTIGNRHDDGPVPVIEDDVDFGAYAQVLGGVRVGRGAKVGAMSVVLFDVPAGSTAVGNPARIVNKQPHGDEQASSPVASRSNVSTS